MRRREFLGAIGGAAAWPLAANSQFQAKTYRVGFLTASTRPALASTMPAFIKSLHQLGWIEGQNLVIEFRYADNRFEKLVEAAAELVRLNVDVIFAGGTLAPLAAKQATSSIPIVFISGDPLGSGLVSNLARPAGNLTGLSLMATDVGGKRLELVKELLPYSSKVAILWNSANPYPVHVFKEMELAAKALKLGIKSIAVKVPNDFAGAFETVRGEKPDALITIEDPLTYTYRKQIADFAVGIGLPTVHGFRGFTEAGGLMSYGARLSDLYRHAAIYVDKIGRGAKPSDLPIQQPTKFDLVINLRTAKALGITVPPTLLARADEVIE